MLFILMAVLFAWFMTCNNLQLIESTFSSLFLQKIVLEAGGFFFQFTQAKVRDEIKSSG